MQCLRNKRLVTSSELWNNEMIREILTKTHQYGAKKCANHPVLMIKRVSSGNKWIFFCYILAVHVRTGDHGKCSRVKKNRFKLAWCSDFVAPTYSAACFSLELRILCFIHQTVFNISYQTVSQFICHRLSFGNPAPFFVVWINRTSSFVGTDIIIKRDHNVFVQIEKLSQMWSASVAMVNCQRNWAIHGKNPSCSELSLFCEHGI